MPRVFFSCRESFFFSAERNNFTCREGYQAPTTFVEKHLMLSNCHCHFVKLKNILTTPPYTTLFEHSDLKMTK